MFKSVFFLHYQTDIENFFAVLPLYVLYVPISLQSLNYLRNFIFHIIFCSMHAVKTVFPRFPFYSPYRYFPLSLSFSSLSLLLSKHPTQIKTSWMFWLPHIGNNLRHPFKPHPWDGLHRAGRRHSTPWVSHLLCLAYYKAQIGQMGMETIVTSCMIFLFDASWFLQLHFYRFFVSWWKIQESRLRTSQSFVIIHNQKVHRNSNHAASRIVLGHHIYSNWISQVKHNISFLCRWWKSDLQ